MKKYLIIFAVVSLSGFLCGMYFVGTPDIRTYSLGYQGLHSNQKAKAGLKLPPAAQGTKIRTRQKEWKRDPFSIASIKEFKGKIHLQAISIDMNGAGIVMINGDSYHKGDMLGSYKIKKIGQDYIIVDKGGENIMVKLEKGD